MNKPSRTGKVAHDLGLSTWFGGTLFGQVSLNPAVSSIGDEAERGRVLNEAWARFQAANLPAMLSTLLGWRLGGVRDYSQLRAPGLTRTKDILVGGAVFNTVASALLGASSVAQLEDTVAALGNLDFGDDELAEIDRHATETGINLWAESSNA